jgi:hypothetical protein
LLLDCFKEVEDVDNQDNEDGNIEVMMPRRATVVANRCGMASTSTPEVATPEVVPPCPLIMPGTTLRCPQPPRTTLDLNRLSLATPPPPRNLHHEIAPPSANPTQDDYYKRKYQETVLRLDNVEAKYNNLLLHHKAYLLKSSSPVELTVRAINLAGFGLGMKVNLFILGPYCQTAQPVEYEIETTSSSGKNMLEDTKRLFFNLDDIESRVVSKLDQLSFLCSSFSSNTISNGLSKYTSKSFQACHVVNSDQLHSLQHGKLCSVHIVSNAIFAGLLFKEMEC